MKLLSLDIGTKRTGIAYVDQANGVPLPLPTLQHESVEELIEQVAAIVKERKIEAIVAGLPLLLSGKEGVQAAYSRDVAQRLIDAKIPVKMLDERYTTPRTPEADGDATVACGLLLLWLEKS